MTSIRIKNVRTQELKTLPVDGLFIAIGHTPTTELFKGKLPMDTEGYLLTEPDSTRTAIPGVFAAGDVKDVLKDLDAQFAKLHPPNKPATTQQRNHDDIGPIRYTNSLDYLALKNVEISVAVLRRCRLSGIHCLR